MNQKTNTFELHKAVSAAYPLKTIRRFRFFETSRCSETKELLDTLRLLHENAGKSQRRSSGRFPFERAIRYETLDLEKRRLCGFGMTVNMSGSGVLFTAHACIPTGTKLKLWIDWLIRLAGHCGLNLAAVGFAVRSVDPMQIAVQFLSHEFHTKSQGTSTATDLLS